MQLLRQAEDRGHARLNWLDSRHSFSFGRYYDPDHMGFGALRVINEDFIQPSGGFDTHGHSDMEIITYVIEGELEHKDSLGNGSVIRPGEVQRMSAGTGIRHSEFNPSDTDPVHLLQIWIIPENEGQAPSYEQKYFPFEERRGHLRLLGSPDGRDGSVTIHQDAYLYGSLLDRGKHLSYPLRPGRRAWIQVARGILKVNGQRLHEGDGLGLRQVNEIAVRAELSAEFLLFDLAD